MQAEVNKIVYNALIAGEDIWLPGVGSLVLEHRSAWRSSSRKLERPLRRVAFLSEEKGRSLIDLIAAAGECDRLTAESIYTRWLDKSRSDDGVTIAGVGELKHKWFTLDPNLDAVLNPSGHEAVTLKPRSSRAAVTWIVLLLLLGAVGYGVWWLKDTKMNPVPAEQPQQTTVSTQEEAQRTAGYGISRPESDLSASADTESTRAAASETLSRPQQRVAGDVADSTAREEAVEPQPTSHPLTVERMTSGRTYAVWGVYSTEENARRAVCELREAHPELSPRIYRYGAKWIVSLRESDSREEIRAYVNRAEGDLKGIWPYSKR